MALGKVHQQAYETVKQLLLVMLPWPTLITLRALRFAQLGVLITQNNRPLVFFGRKLSPMQQKYSMTKQELQVIMEKPIEFKSMLLGQQLMVYTGHKNLMQDALGLTSD